jgi:hypothetical protein
MIKNGLMSLWRCPQGHSEALFLMVDEPGGKTPEPRCRLCQAVMNRAGIEDERKARGGLFLCGATGLHLEMPDRAAKKVKGRMVGSEDIPGVPV